MKIQVQLTYEENLQYYGVNKNDIVEVEFEQYVAAVTASEIGNTYIEACKAQAIAARSFAISRGVLNGKPISDSSATAQSYRAARYNNNTFPNCIQAALLTQGEVLLYNEKVINSIYTASNGGRTVSSKEKWGNELPYLIAQNDPWDAVAGFKKNGTGVGMSQHGAMQAAKIGKNYQQILSFYYPKTYLCKEYGQTKGKKVIQLAKDKLGYPYVFGAIGPNEFDCRGFTYWCLKQVGVTLSTVGATTQWNTTKWVDKGKTIDGIPNCVCCVFKQKENKMSHTGLHIGDGLIIHCSGEVKYGSIDNTTWTHWGIPPGLHDSIYLSEVKEVKAMATMKKGSSGENVYKLQIMLSALGYDCGVPDGKFGTKTEQAVRIFQTKNRLTIDGVVGKATLPVIEAQYEALQESKEKDTDETSKLKETLAVIRAQMEQIQSQIDECQRALDEL